MKNTTWKVALVAIVKNEALYLQEWIIHHLSLGVEHVILYDNGSDDNTLRTVSKFINAGVLTYVAWPMRGGQIDAYNHAAKFLRHSAEWVGFLDADEYCVLHHHDNVYDFLSSLETDEVLVPWRNFPHSGHAVKPGGRTIENYLWAYPVSEGQIVQVKHFVRAEQINKVYAHFSLVNSGKIRLADGSEGRFSHAISSPTYKGAQINHYATRSQAENVARLQKGQVSGSAHKRPDPFHPLTKEVAARHEYDASILRHFPKFISEEIHWDRVADYPHRFGLSQKSDVLLSWNDVLYYYAKSFGNYLLGEVDIKPTTNFVFMRPEEHRASTNIGGFLLEYSRLILLFSVEMESFQSYFLGSVHYSDFARRFNFKCLLMEHDYIGDILHATISTSDGHGMFCLYDVENAAPVKIHVKVSANEMASLDIPAGRHAGAVYIPKCQNGEIVLTLEGEAKTRELLVGILP